jgi:hypothetical protein
MWHQSRAALALILERNEMALQVSVVEYGAPTTIVYEMSTAIETLRFFGLRENVPYCSCLEGMVRIPEDLWLLNDLGGCTRCV